MKVAVVALLVVLSLSGFINADENPAPEILPWWPTQPPWWPSKWPTWPTKPTTTPKPPTCEHLRKYPDLTDCSKYKLCLLGSLYAKTCPWILHFNDPKQKCDLPLNAQCAVTTEAPETTTQEVTTTEEKCVDYWKYSHESDCNKYYLCLGGDFYVQDCPVSLHFNNKIRNCDRPANANCETTTTTEPPCEDFKFYPHPFDCRKYYQCLGGRLHMLECPEYLGFNPERQFCDYPHLANCPVSPPKCENRKKYPHEVDCNKYYQCVDESLYLLTCQYADLHFNAILQDCDLPGNAMCEIDIRK